jgi:UDP:flavonoid glycosyltransferase YjiC (YdhE family)
MLLGKPLLVMPERCVEQRMNARAVAELGIGLRVEQRLLAISHLRELLARRLAFVARMRELRRDGLSEALATIETFIGELVAARLRSAGERRGAGPALLAGRRPVMP